MLTDAQCAASIPASDIERAKRWYAEKLGLEPTRGDNMGGFIYETGQGTGFYLYPSAFAGTNQATAMGFGVEDFDQEAKELRSRGVVFEDYDFDELKTIDGVATMPDGSKGAWFKDSEGNILSLASEM